MYGVYEALWQRDLDLGKTERQKIEDFLNVVLKKHVEIQMDRQCEE